MKDKIFRDFQPSIDEFREFETAIKSKGENSCRDKLLHFAEALAKWHDLHLEFVLQEVIVNLTGKRSDLVLCGILNDEKRKHESKPAKVIEQMSLTPRKRAIIYELKSPKSSIFTKQTNKKLSRYVPSKDLICAETQLIEYKSYLTSDKLKEVAFANWDIKYGGIIIGMKYDDDQELNTTIGSSSDLRKREFYEPLGIKLYNWDDILSKIKEEFKY